MQRAVLCWLASCMPQRLQICLPSASRSPSKCWVSNEKAAQSSKGALMKRKKKRGEKWAWERRNSTKMGPILLFKSLNMKILCSVLLRYPCLVAFKVTVNCYRISAEVRTWLWLIYRQVKTGKPFEECRDVSRITQKTELLCESIEWNKYSCNNDINNSWPSFINTLLAYKNGQAAQWAPKGKFSISDLRGHRWVH